MTQRGQFGSSYLGSSGFSLCIVLLGAWFGTQVTMGGNKRVTNQLLPDYGKVILPMLRTTMTGTNFSTSQRIWKTNSFSIIEVSSSCQTLLRGSDSCRRWNGLNCCADRRRIASYIPCGVSWRQRIVFGSSTSLLPDDAVLLSEDGVWLAGRSQGVALATVGLLVPLRWIVAGTVRRHWAFKGNCGYAWFGLRFCATTCIWGLPVLT